MVYRVFVEKKKELCAEAKALLSDARNLLGITALCDVRVINRYDAENGTFRIREKNGFLRASDRYRFRKRRPFGFDCVCRRIFAGAV